MDNKEILRDQLNGLMKEIAESVKAFENLAAVAVDNGAISLANRLFSSLVQPTKHTLDLLKSVPKDASLTALMRAGDQLSGRFRLHLAIYESFKPEINDLCNPWRTT